jgi:hypothetical protein
LLEMPRLAMRTEVAGHRYRLPDDRIAIWRQLPLESGIGFDFYVSHLTDRAECIDGIAVRTMQARELAGWAAASRSTETTVILFDPLEYRAGLPRGICAFYLRGTDVHLDMHYHAARNQERVYLKRAN